MNEITAPTAVVPALGDESSASFDAPVDGLRGRATSGVVKTGLSQAVRLVVQFGSVIILSRLLLPSEFGLVAMAGPIVSFAALFQDLGLTQAIVQKPKLTQAEVSTLFAISVGMSVCIALALIALSPLVAWYYGQPRVGLLTTVMGLSVIISGLSSVHYALLNRRMKFTALAIIDAASAVAGLLAAALGALIFRNFWALYLGGLASTVVPAIGFWVAESWRPSLPRRGSDVKSSLHFGANVTGFNVANFFARNLDNVLIGHTWGDRPLGLYDRAYKLLLMPLQQINNPMSKVMLPVLAQLAPDPARYRAAYLRTLSQMLLITLPGIAFMIGTSDLLIPTLLGRQWADAAPIFAALGLASFVQALNNPSGWLFISQHRTQEYMYWGLFNSITCIIGFVIGLPYGPLGVAIGYAGGELLRTPLLWWYVTRSGPIRATDIISQAAPHYVGALVSFAAILLVRHFATTEVWLLFALCLVVSFGVSLLIIGMFPRGRAVIGNSIDLVQGGLRRA